MRVMDTIVNLRILLYLASCLFHRGSSETFTSVRSSFLQLKRWNVSETRCLAFRFKTFLPDALLLYMDDEGNTNFLRLELIQGKLRLTCSYGSRFGAMAVEIGDNLNDLVWHRVLLERNKENTTIYLDSLPKLPVESREKKGLIIKSPMYFGGLPPNLGANRVTQPSVILLNRFIGCITDIELLESSSGRGNTKADTTVENADEVAPGCTDMCERNNTCLNNGSCLNRFIASGCDCIATGYRGDTCEQALPVLGLSQSDHVVFNRCSKAISTKQDRIILRFKTANQNGSLLESGRWARDYLVIELSGGYLLLRWNLGSGEMYMHVRDKPCSDDKWHSVDIRRNRRQLNLTIDGGFHVSESFPGKYRSFDLKEGEGDVFVGGMATNSFIPSRRSSSIPFKGCLQEINFNGVDIIQGVLDRKDAFITLGSPRLTCEISKHLTTTTAAMIPHTTTATPSTKTEQRTTSYTTTWKMTTKVYTDSSQRTSTSPSFSGNSGMPCSDDEDDCGSEDSGSGENENTSGFSGHSGDNYIYSGSGDEHTKVKTIISGRKTNNSKNKSIKVVPPKNKNKSLQEVPSKAPDSETKGESDISCTGDDEDSCENGNESGQGSAEVGSATGSTTLNPRTLPNDNGIVQAKRRAYVKESSSKKWTLIAGIIVVGTLLVAFCIFAIWWLWKNKNNPEWTGMYKVNGSREKCLQAEATDV